MTLVQYGPRLLVPEVMARRFDIQPWRRLAGGHKRGDALSSHLAMGRRVIKSPNPSARAHSQLPEV
jgi:hypothetical protein